MKLQAFYITGTTYEEYLAWCKENNRPAYKQSSKREFFTKIRIGKLCRDNITGKLVNKRPRK